MTTVSCTLGECTHLCLQVPWVCALSEHAAAYSLNNEGIPSKPLYILDHVRKPTKYECDRKLGVAWEPLSISANPGFIESVLCFFGSWMHDADPWMQDCGAWMQHPGSMDAGPGAQDPGSWIQNHGSREPGYMDTWCMDPVLDPGSMHPGYCIQLRSTSLCFVMLVAYANFDIANSWRQTKHTQHG